MSKINLIDEVILDDLGYFPSLAFDYGPKLGGLKIVFKGTVTLLEIKSKPSNHLTEKQTAYIQVSVGKKATISLENKSWRLLR